MSSVFFAPDNHEYEFSPPNLEALPIQEWPNQKLSIDSHQRPLEREIGSRHLHIVRDMPAGDYRLGLPELPVAPYRDLIVQTIAENPATVISSETGSGKSSQVGLFLLEEGWNRIFVTQPRILAARELKDRAQYSLGPDYAHLAGYKTGFETDSEYGPDTRLFYITEELLFKYASRGQLQAGDVIINDEAHERTPPTIFLQALTKEIIAENPHIKLVISSATIDEEKFSKYLGDPVTGKAAPILKLPGRTFPIEDRFTDDSVALAARKLMRQGHNVLTFEPGFQRMNTTRYQIGARKIGETVHLLYGDQSPTEQKEALNPSDHNHIVSTRVGETSITPQNKDAVVDSGLSNYGKYEQGVRVLQTAHSSKATMEQRRGRVGRTKPGKYVLAVPDNALPIDYDDREEYDPSPIANSSITNLVLELLRSGRRIEELDLLELPNPENFAHDLKVLKRLGAIAIEDGVEVITDIGRALTNLSLEAPLARMLVAAREIGEKYEVDPEIVRIQVAASASIRTVRGILDVDEKSKRRYMKKRKSGVLSSDFSSDLLFELDAFVQLREKQLDFLTRDVADPVLEFEQFLRSRDIKVSRYNKAVRTLEELCRREGLDITKLRKPEGNEREAIVACQITGADELFVQKSALVHWDIRGRTRRLGQKSTINPSQAKLVVGTAFDYRGMRANGTFEKRFITGGSAVTTEMLLNHGGHRVVRQSYGHVITPEGTILERQALYFDGEIMFDQVNLEPSPTFKTREFIIRAMMTGIGRDSRNPEREVLYHPKTPNAKGAVTKWKEGQDLNHKSKADLKVDERYEKLINRVIRDSVKKMPLEVTDPEMLDQIIPKVYRASLVRPTRKNDIPLVERTSPDAIVLSNDEGEKTYVEVKYLKNNDVSVAYITLESSMKYMLKPEDIEDLLEHHPVKIRVLRTANNKYMRSDIFFKYIEEEKNAPNRVKRRERKALAAAQKSTPEGQLEAIKRQEEAKRKPAELLPILKLVKKSKLTGSGAQRRARNTPREPRETSSLA